MNAERAAAEAAPTTLRVAEPPLAERGPILVGPAQASLRHPFIALLTALLCVGGAVAIGLTRSPQYTAEARLNVGRIDVPAYTLQGVIIGNQSLAQSYSRAISAPYVLNAAARAARLSGGAARSRLTATPVAQSTVIRIQATGLSKRAAVALANGASQGLMTYVVKLNKNAQANTVLSDFRQAQREVVDAQKRVAALSSKGSKSAALQRARLNLQTAELKARTLGQQYQFQAGNEAPPNLVQLLAPATSASSDFRSRLEELVLIGLVAGLLAGLALALMCSNVELLRSRA